MQFGINENAQENIEVVQVNIQIEDMRYNRAEDTNKTVYTKIEKRFIDDGNEMILKPRAEPGEHNILLYVETLGAKVSGVVDYKLPNG